MYSLIAAIRAVTFVLNLIVIAQVIVSYFMSPYHPVRRSLDQIVEPMLAPIRRLVPPLGGFDFSPIVLLVLIQIAEQVLVQVLVALA